MRTGGLIIGLTAIADALAGVVARRTNKVTVFGAFYDSTLDRVADGALLAGLAYFYAVNPIHANKWMLAITLAGIIGTYLVSYARARAEALGINAKVGVMQRAERVALLCAPQALFGLAFDGWVLIGVVVLLSVSAWHTAIHRINHVRLSTQATFPPPSGRQREASATGNRTPPRAALNTESWHLQTSGHLVGRRTHLSQPPHPIHVMR